jgi:ABC-type multidrug transport system ATPase subunit
MLVRNLITNGFFRNINFSFQSPMHYGLLGSNGSGKTTLLKIISGYLLPSEGTIEWKSKQFIDGKNIFKYVGIASPHIEVIEEFSFREILTFHQKFRNYINNYEVKDLLQLSELKRSADKPIKYYSSGMKQRVKLILAIMSDNEIILLDEPCSNLDKSSIEWYKNLITSYTGERVVIIGSNDKETECFSCKKFLQI